MSNPLSDESGRGIGALLGFVLDRVAREVAASGTSSSSEEYVTSTAFRSFSGGSERSEEEERLETVDRVGYAVGGL